MPLKNVVSVRVLDMRAAERTLISLCDIAENMSPSKRREIVGLTGTIRTANKMLQRQLTDLQIDELSKVDVMARVALILARSQVIVSQLLSTPDRKISVSLNLADHS